MKLVPAKLEDVLAAIMRGTPTTYERVSDKQREYTCRLCDKAFYATGYISYNVCESCFGPMNLRVIEYRLVTGQEPNINMYRDNIQQ